MATNHYSLYLLATARVRRAEIVQKRLAGMTLAKLGEAFGVSAPRISAILRRAVQLGEATTEVLRPLWYTKERARSSSSSEPSEDAGVRIVPALKAAQKVFADAARKVRDAFMTRMKWNRRPLSLAPPYEVPKFLQKHVDAAEDLRIEEVAAHGHREKLHPAEAPPAQKKIRVTEVLNIDRIIREKMRAAQPIADVLHDRGLSMDDLYSFFRAREKLVSTKPIEVGATGDVLARAAQLGRMDEVMVLEFAEELYLAMSARKPLEALLSAWHLVFADLPALFRRYDGACKLYAQAQAEEKEEAEAF